MKKITYSFVLILISTDMDSAERLWSARVIIPIPNEISECHLFYYMSVLDSSRLLATKHPCLWFLVPPQGLAVLLCKVSREQPTPFQVSGRWTMLRSFISWTVSKDVWSFIHAHIDCTELHWKVFIILRTEWMFFMEFYWSCSFQYGLPKKSPGFSFSD